MEKFLPSIRKAAALVSFAFIATIIFAVSKLAFAADADLPADQFFGQVIDAIKAMGGLPWAAKFGAVILLLVSSMKVSFLRPLWDKLGAAKAWAALGLALVGGILMLSVEGKLTLAGVVAYVVAGGGAVIMHELLDTVKAIPGLGSVWIAVIDLLSKLLGGDKPVVAASMKK